MKTVAMTLGPIVDTLSMGRKTSEIWMASYMFSWIMKESIKGLKEQGADFIVPYADEAKIFEEKDNGIGRFHDRFVFQSDTLSMHDAKDVVNGVKVQLAATIAEATNLEEKLVKQQINDYIQTYFAEWEGTLKNPILDTSPTLDALELHTPPLPHGDHAIRKFLQRNTILQSPLAKKSFGKNPSFDSIPAIAAQEEKADIKKNDDFKNAYKYIAIVQADGDNLGVVIEKEEKPKTFSKKLFDFAESASQTLKDFGAQILYVGGDDLLFFAPVLHRDGRTIFDLVDDLSKNYADALQDKTTSLSFGISITYYKYPLYEALERARAALFGTAKKHPGKNAVAVSVQKHSGQSFKFCVGKEEESYTLFEQLLYDNLNEKVEIPHSLHHKLAELQPLFKKADAVKIHNIFENFFDEDTHKEKFARGLEAVENLTLATKDKEVLFDMLSTIKLLRGDR
jgi:CRISPR-associated protein Cmr2